MGRLSVGLVALLLLWPTVRGEQDPAGRQQLSAREELETIVKKHGATTPGDRYRALCREYDEAREGYERALKEAKSDEERQSERRPSEQVDLRAGAQETDADPEEAAE